MIVYKSTRENLLIPVFFGFLMLAACFTPAKDLLSQRTNHTDTYTGRQEVAAITTLAQPDKTEVEDLKVPVLGAVSTPVKTSTSQDNNSAPVAANSVSLAGRTIPLYNNATNPGGVTPPEGIAYKYTAYNFIYGHNSANVFGGLYGTLAPGTILTVNLDGQTAQYRFLYNAYNDISKNGGVEWSYIFADGSDKMTILTCAPGVSDPVNDRRRVVLIFEKL